MSDTGTTIRATTAARQDAEQQEHQHERGGERDQRDRPRVAQRRLDVAGRAVDVRVDRDALQARGHVRAARPRCPG